MKSISIIIFMLINLFSINNIVSAETFLETIAEVSARDAITIGPDNNLYSSNYNTGVIYRITPNGEVSIVLTANNNGPAGIRFDNAGNMLVAMYNIGEVVTVVNGQIETFSSGIREPIALDWDDLGNLYVSNFAGTTTVTKVTPDGTSESFASINQLSSVSSLCIDSDNNVYVTSYGSGDIYKVSPSGDISLFSSTGLEGFGYIQFDEFNNKLFATVINQGQIIEVDLDGNHIFVVNASNNGFQDGTLDIASMDPAIGLAVAEDGNSIYFATQNHVRRALFADPQVDQIAPYFTSTPITSASQDSAYSYQYTFEDPNNDALTLEFSDLPAWLAFDGTDTISGTPSANDSGQTYTVTASLNDSLSTVVQSYELVVSGSTPPPPAPAPSGSSGGGPITMFSLLLLVFIFRERLLANHN